MRTHAILIMCEIFSHGRALTRYQTYDWGPKINSYLENSHILRQKSADSGQISAKNKHCNYGQFYITNICWAREKKILFSYSWGRSSCFDELSNVSHLILDLTNVVTNRNDRNNNFKISHLTLYKNSTWMLEQRTIRKVCRNNLDGLGGYLSLITFIHHHGRV